MRRLRAVPRYASPFPGDALQPLRQPALRRDLPCGRYVPAQRRDRGLRPLALHRLQGVHAGLPIRRRLHRPRTRDGGQVPFLRSPGRGGDAAGVRGGLPRAGDRRRRPRRSGERGLAPDRSGASHGAQAGKADTAQALLRGGGGGGDRPGPGAQRRHVPFRHGQHRGTPGAPAGRARPLAWAHGARDRVLRRGAHAAVGLAGAGLFLDKVGIDRHLGPPGAGTRHRRG